MTGRPVPPDDSRAVVVWRSGDVELTTCPVRAITPEARAVIEWFDLTHELTANGTAVWWRAHTLPSDGGVDEQDARLMASLDYVRAVNDALVAQQAKEQRAAGSEARRRKRDRG